jgi:hypothetical protein
VVEIVGDGGHVGSPRSVPRSGFMVGFFPIKLAGCSAAPARVEAFVD